MKKRCIWNWDHGKKIEYLEERGKKAKFETIFGIGIASVAGIFFGVLPLIVIFYYIFEITRHKNHLARKLEDYDKVVYTFILLTITGQDKNDGTSRQ